MSDNLFEILQSTVTVDDDGTQTWYYNGKIHRVDGPAVIHKNGDVEWFFEGELHREDAPSIEYADGSYEFHIHGKRHRVGAPAIVYTDESNGSKLIANRLPGYAKIKPDLNAPRTEYWYLNDKLHRDDGPAVVECEGSTYWYRHGYLHRDDGPAVIDSNGTERWYKNGIRFYP